MKLLARLTTKPNSFKYLRTRDALHLCEHELNVLLLVRLAQRGALSRVTWATRLVPPR